ncbi:MAG: iron ABC transporter permease [Muribaculaceae bacterium]|nr:iron ABC transporter permease [Muribaculaceae bacterium]
MKRPVTIIASLAAFMMFLMLVDLGIGSVGIPLSNVWAALTGGDCSEATRRIVVDIRLVKAVTALVCGVALSVSGLQMQTLFRNPLAGPYVLGISSGASLGVALLILGAPLLGLSPVLGNLGIAGAAWIGSVAVLSVITIVGRRIADIMVILILGMMFSSGIGALVQILQYLSDEHSLKAYVIWTMGSLSDVTADRLWVMLGAVGIGLVLAVAAVKSLNLMLLGEDYARGMGVDVRRWRMVLFASTSLLAGTVTAFCGPIGFIGLAMPHVARMAVGSGDHRVLLPASMFGGGAVMLLCDIVSKIYVLPVNAVTALLGIPVVVWIVLHNSAKAR